MNNQQFLSGAVAPGECIGGGWELVSGKFGMYVGMGLLTILMIGCIPFASWFLLGPVLGGFYYVVLRDMRGEPVDFGMLFKGFEKFVPLMIAGLVQAAPGIILTIIQWTVDLGRLFGPAAMRGGDFYQGSTQDMVFSSLSVVMIFVIIGVSLFAIVWQIALQFAVPLIIDRGLGVGEALALSARAAASNVGGLIVLIILQMLVGLLGLIALCVGIFVAMPVVYAANAFAYRQMFPYFESAFETGPPPPQAYGGSFGNNY